MNVDIAWFPDCGHIVAGIFLVQTVKRFLVVLHRFINILVRTVKIPIIILRIILIIFK